MQDLLDKMNPEDISQVPESICSDGRGHSTDVLLP
jgi:hypothetical protein